MKVWKVSHGQVLSESDRRWLAQHQYLSVHEDTGNAGGDNFINQMKVNDIVSLSYGGQLAKLVKVTSDIIVDQTSPMDDGWKLRHYEDIKVLDQPMQYKGVDKGWTPIRRNTCAPVPSSELTLFEQAILQPYYQLALSEIGLVQKETIYPWIEKCQASESFVRFLNKKGLNKEVLNDAIRVVHQAEPNFDLYNINKSVSCLRFGSKDSTSKSGKVAGLFLFEKGSLKIFFSKRYDREVKRLVLGDDIKVNEVVILNELNSQLSIFKENGLTGHSRLPIEYGEEQSNDSEDDQLGLNENLDANIPLNQILYGPPGTGKTYHTVEASVKAAEPSFLPSGESKDDIRKAYKARYDELVKAGRIRFVTFHQSYGYEEFVEGLSAKTEGDQLSYFEKDGIFKTICDEAKSYRVAINESILSSFDQRWQLFAEYLAESESGIVIKTLSKKTYFTVTDVTNNTIRFDKSKGSSIHSLSVKTLKAVYYKEKQIVGGLQPYYGAFIEHLNQFDLPVTKARTERKNFVLIIDEINRGNISKIFGELITLIEPSKRLGQAERLEAILPYSGDLFSVPDNLYLIGTMNTADRSLALMDTALRRRFDFKEMMPDYDKCSEHGGINLDGVQVDLAKLLKKMNERITALYDREHTLGHAFLMPVVDKIKQGDHQTALTELAKCFQNKIIPLLAEYFYEDWQKIRLVLGDNQKPTDYRLMEQSDVDYEELFGGSDDVGDYAEDVEDYQLIKTDSDLWLDALTYIGMYKASDLPKKQGQPTQYD
ncbi:McrB family protein [Shewanella glacialipiscicola]|uniref:McrB family protein n=1 Tax=Shewanella glacialipiscicola TaxID=614069 RepID=UPI003D7A134C